MRTLLALLFTLILLVTALQADAVNEGNEKRMKAKRQLLSETDLGRKIDAGGSDTLGNIPTNKGSENANTADSDSRSKQGTDTADDGNDANDSYQNYGNDSGDTQSRHIFVKTDPPVHH